MPIIDDRDAGVSYSQPSSGGHWSNQSGGSSYGDTLKLTRTRNAYAQVSFSGTSINVYGTISPSDTGSGPQSSYSIDGSPPVVFTGTRTNDVQSRKEFFKSNTLSDGQHTLMIVNNVEGAYFWLDYFDIVQPETAPAPQAPSNPTPNPNTDPSPNPNPQSSPTTTSIINTSATKTDVGPSTGTHTKTESLPSNNSQNPTPTPNNITKTDSTPGSSLTTNNTNLLNSNNPSDGEKKTPTGAIVGGVVGGLVLLVLLLLLFLWRRRKVRKVGLEAGSNTVPGSLWAPSQTQQQSGIIPFSVPPSTQNFSSMHQCDGFNQQNMVTRRAGGPYYAETLPPIQLLGKRQVAAPSSSDICGSTSALLSDQARANASTPSSGMVSTQLARHNGTPGGSMHIGSDGSTLYSDPAGNLYNVTPHHEESPPAYQVVRRSGGEQNGDINFGVLGKQ